MVSGRCRATKVEAMAPGRPPSHRLADPCPSMTAAMRSCGWSERSSLPSETTSAHTDRDEDDRQDGQQA